MSQTKNRSIGVKGRSVAIVSAREDDFISLTDIARYRNTEHTDDLIRNRLRNRNTLAFLGIWERLDNSGFNPVEFDGIGMEAGLNSFTLTPKQWIERTGAVGITSKPGRYGGTYAHKDIAFEFATSISMEFKLYLIKEFQRLKTQEASRESREWNFQRTLAKVNYRIHTDAIQEHLIPPELTKAQIQFVCASEADLLNDALFGRTAAERLRQRHPASARSLLDATGHAVLSDAGKVIAEIAKAHAESEFEKYRIVQDRLFESDFDRVVAETKRLSEGAPTDTLRKENR